MSPQLSIYVLAQPSVEQRAKRRVPAASWRQRVCAVVRQLGVDSSRFIFCLKPLAHYAEEALALVSEQTENLHRDQELSGGKGSQTGVTGHKVA